MKLCVLLYDNLSLMIMPALLMLIVLILHNTNLFFLSQKSLYEARLYDVNARAHSYLIFFVFYY